MFRFTRRAFNSLNTIVKQQQCVHTLCINNNKSAVVIKLPQVYTALFSTDSQKPEYYKPILESAINKKEEETKQKKEEEEARKARESSWRTMKYTLYFFGVSFVTLGGYLIVVLGKPPVDQFGNPIEDKYAKMPIVKQYLLRTLDELEWYSMLLKAPSREKLLPDPVKYPFYQPKYTLVVELTDVLVHPEWTYLTGWRFKKRPGVDKFLEALSQFYEIVIYTAEQGMTVFPILDAMDPKHYISYKLVRDSTNFVDGHHVKDVNRLNRDLSKVIVVDWNPDSVKFNPENLFRIKRWNGNDNDTELLDLVTFLETIVALEVEDVREVMQFYGQYDDPIAAFKAKREQLLDRSTSSVTELDKNLREHLKSLAKRRF